MPNNSCILIEIENYNQTNEIKLNIFNKEFEKNENILNNNSLLAIENNNYEEFIELYLKKSVKRLIKNIISFK